MEIKNEEFVTWTKAKKILADKSKNKELGYEQKNALEFLKKFSKLSNKKTEKAIEELEKIGKLKKKHIVMIINMQPKDMEDLNVLFANEIMAPSKKEKEKILKVTKKLL